MARRLGNLVRFILHPASLTLALVLAVPACTTMWNPTPPTGESQTIGSPVQLTSGYAAAQGARFSADGRWILFRAAEQAQPAQLYLAQLRFNADRSITGLYTPVRITPGGNLTTLGCLSPNGTSLYFSCASKSSTSPQPWPILNLYRADGWQGAISALAPGEPIDLAQHPLTSNNAYNAQAALSPDARWLIFVSTQSGQPALAAIAANGSDIHTLAGSAETDRWPSVCPDGRQLLFQRDVNGRPQVMTAEIAYDNSHAPIALQHVRQVTRDGGSDPCWHPDGRHILFSAPGPGGDVELYLIRSDGSRITRLTFTPGPDLSPALSPDGQWLIWSSTRGGSPQLFLSRFTLPQGS